MFFAYIALIAYLCAAAFADNDTHDQSELQELGLNATTTLFEAVYPNPEKFNDKCTGTYKVITRILKSNETIVVADFNAFIEKNRNSSQLIDFDMNILDSNKDGKVSRDEFCSQVEMVLKSKTVGDLQNLNLDEASIAQLKPLVCTWKDKIPFMKDEVCEAIEEAQEKIEDQKEQQEKSVELVKRQLSKGTLKLAGGMSLAFGILWAFAGLITLVGAIVLHPTVLIMTLITATMAFLFIKLGVGLLDASSRAT